MEIVCDEILQLCDLLFTQGHLVSNFRGQLKIVVLNVTGNSFWGCSYSSYLVHFYPADNHTGNNINVLFPYLKISFLLAKFRVLQLLTKPCYALQHVVLPGLRAYMSILQNCGENLSLPFSFVVPNNHRNRFGKKM